MNLTTASSKLRSVILFRSQRDQEFYKRLITDLADKYSLAPSETVTHLALADATETWPGKQAAEILYADGRRCTAVFESLFSSWAAIAPKGGDEKPLVESFFDYANHHQLCIDTDDERMNHLKSQWDCIGLLIEHAAKGDPDDLEIMLAARETRSLEPVLSQPNGALSISAFISCILESWTYLKRKSSTYRALTDFAYLAKSAFPEMAEPAEERLALLRLIDKFSREEDEAKMKQR